MSGRIQISPKTRLERLRNARRVMAAVAEKPRTAFRIEIWGQQVSPDGIDAPPCGTVACTAGWMGLDPWFQSQGLSFSLLDLPVCPRIEGRTVGITRYALTRDEVFLSEWMGLTDPESERLFCDGPPDIDEPTAANMRDYLDELIAKYEKVK